jgi:rubrerythrin
MTQQPQEAPAKHRKPKNFAAINGACKMAKLSDGYESRSCPKCGTNHKLKACPWCGHKRGKK